jgi:hypothetical protein
MDANKYLEEIVAASYAREIDQEENVYRTLPFAATALAIIFSFMVFIRSDIPDKLSGIYPILIWVMLSFLWGVIAIALVFLWRTVGLKPLQFLSSPSELYKYLTDLRTYYTAVGTPPDQIEQRVVEDARSLMVEQYTVGATHNQRINEQRLRARARAFQTLILAVILALTTVVIILTHMLIRGGSGGTIAVQGWN